MPSTVVPLATFRARYPEFDGVPDATVDLRLEDAEADTSPSVFDTLHARAISALAAHRLATTVDEDGEPIGEQGGMLQQAQVDGVVAMYVVPDGLSPADTLLWASHYGQEFIQMRNRGTAGPILARR